jgi:hypothetical protein
MDDISLMSRLKGEKQTTASSSGNQSRKRKAPLSPSPTVPDQQSVAFPWRLALPIYNDLAASNLLACWALNKLEAEGAAKPEASSSPRKADL